MDMTRYFINCNNLIDRNNRAAELLGAYHSYPNYNTANELLSALYDSRFELRNALSSIDKVIEKTKEEVEKYEQ